MLRRFCLALGFMTRIPVPMNWEVQDGELEKSIAYFPADRSSCSVFYLPQPFGRCR